MTDWFFGRVQPVTMSMKLVDDQGDPYEVSWRPELPQRPMFLRSVSVLDAAGVPIATIPFTPEKVDGCEGAPE